MGRLILHNLKHFFITFILLLCLLIIFGLHIGADAHFNTNRLAFQVAGEGPHLFHDGTHWQAHILRGDRDAGFYAEKITLEAGQTIDLPVYFAFEEQTFAVTIDQHIVTPPVSYHDGQPILAISDIEADGNGGIWLGLWNTGVAYIAGSGDVTSVTKAELGIEGNIHDLELVGAEVWVATSFGLVRFDPSTRSSERLVPIPDYPNTAV